MKETHLTVDEEDMTFLIRDLLELEHKSKWQHISENRIISIKFLGNCHNVQMDIYKWLHRPERMENMINLCNK